MGAPGPGSPRTGLRPWGEDPDFGTWDCTNAMHKMILLEAKRSYEQFFYQIATMYDKRKSSAKPMIEAVRTGKRGVFK